MDTSKSNSAQATAALYETIAILHMVHLVPMSDISGWLRIDLGTAFKGSQRYAPEWIFTDHERVQFLRSDGQDHENRLWDTAQTLAWLRRKSVGLPPMGASQ